MFSAMVVMGVCGSPLHRIGIRRVVVGTRSSLQSRYSFSGHDDPMRDLRHAKGPLLVSDIPNLSSGTAWSPIQSAVPQGGLLDLLQIFTKATWVVESFF